MNRKTPEISWSLMHPVALDVEYMKYVIEQAKHYQVDSFEICAECHSIMGGMEGLVLYEDFPEVAAAVDREGILANRQKLREILQLAHSSGREVYYWHREVMVCPEMLQACPLLRDANGEFDLLGEAYEKLLRYKLAHTFEAVPELDGLVLTLTESDFSVIHNSTPELYPPAQVVAKIVRIFAEEHVKRGKRFILRSFGSIAQDYEDILTGARQVAPDFSFEVETKILPYDFDPFLPDCPYLQKIPNLTLGAECCAIGASFMGSGYLPAENLRNIVRFVRWGQQCKVDRFTIRIDRVGNNIFDTYPINIFAYEQAILHPGITVQEISHSYAAKHYPASCRHELEELGYLGFEVIARMNYIDQQLIFHMLPLEADLKWIKAGGIFTVFKNHQSLALHDGLYAILSDKMTPGRDFIRREKDEALRLAEQGLATVEKLRPLLPEAEYARLKRLWSNAVVGCHAFRALIRVICAYFDDMEQAEATAPHLKMELDALERELKPLMTHPEKWGKVAGKNFVNGMDRNLFIVAGDDLDQVYLLPIHGMTQLIAQEFPLEWAARKKLSQLPGVLDFVVPGAITDEYRCRRNMHASHALVQNGALGRLVGNKVFPNGFLELNLKGDANVPLVLKLTGQGACQVTANGQNFTCDLSVHPDFELPPASKVKVVLHKIDKHYPLINTVALCRK